MRSAIAVVGVGAVLPDARSTDDYWKNLRDGRVALRAPGEVGFDTCTPFPVSAGVGNITFRGGWISDRWQLDWRRYRIPPADAAAVNRMQFATLDAGTQALSTVKQLPRQRTAILVGATGLGFQKDVGLHVRGADLVDAVRGSRAFAELDAAVRERVLATATRRLAARLKECSSDDTVGSLASVAAARIAMHHDLYGPHYAVDADHASSLAALEIAIAGLQDGEWDCALAGGVSELITPAELAAYARAGLLSPTGRLRPFAPDADGTLLGEGAAMVALKRLDDALADGDDVLALVHGVASATSATAAPSSDAIARAVADAWREAGRDPAEAHFYECHGAGTVGADAAEVAALRSLVHGDGRAVPIGAVKAKVGHLRAAAGAAGLVATVLALRHRCLPPTLDADDGVRDLASRLQPVERALPLPAERTLTAGVTAVALDGRVWHAVVESFAPGPRARLAAPSFRFEPLAVTGMAGLYAGAPDLDQLWRNLVAGRDEVTEVPASRWPVARHHDPAGKARDKSVTGKGSFIELPRADGDAAADERDPTQLLAARVALAAWRDAGAPACDPRRARVFLGFMPFVGRRWLAEARINQRELAAALTEELAAAGVPTALAQRILDESERAFIAGMPPFGGASLTGWLGGMAAAAVARAVGVAGGHLAVESACASTLAALHAAAQSLRAGRCDVAIVGGAWCDIAPEFYVATSRFNALSPDGIAPFAARANGFVPGEGAGFVVLERVDEAERRGARVRGVVRACAGASDGKGRSVLTPSVDGEALALQRALDGAGLVGADVAYVECHGTGTALGDATEAMALACTYGGGERAAPLAIGSVKSNLGHLVAAAGAPALHKALLALEHEALPPSLHCETPNPKIDFAAARLEPVRAIKPWPRGERLRRAGVSAFGIGGSNFHVIVEEGAAISPDQRSSSPSSSSSSSPPPSPSPSPLFVVAGHSIEECIDELRSRAAMLAEVSSDDFADAAQATRQDAQARAAHSAARLALTAASSQELEERIDALARLRAEGRPLTTLAPLGLFAADTRLDGPRVLLFPGQGPQYPGMLRELAATLPAVVETLERADEVWRRLTGRPLRPALWPEPGVTPSDEDLHAAVFTVSCALATALARVGVRGDLYVGQSAGELAALVAAGVLDFADGLRAIYARTRAVLALPLEDAGCMASLACSAAQVGALAAGIAGTVVVAAENCATSSLASGGRAAMTELLARAADAGIDHVPLAVSHAYHSPLIAGAADAYRETLRQLEWRPPRATVLSTVDLAEYDADVDASIERLVRQYTTPVRFGEAIERAFARGARLFIESGPKWPLTSYVRQILDGRPFVAQAAIHPKVGERLQFNRLLACAFVHGDGRLEEAGSSEEETMKPKLEAITTAGAAAGEATFALVRARLVAALAERTGYPEEMLDLDLDLEGDLGIDTVKQVEVFARVRDELGLAREEGVSLRQLNTLRKVIERLAARLGGATTAPPATTHSPSMPSPSTPSPLPTTTTMTKSRFEEVRTRVVAALAERTGYPEDMLDLDLDLEGDLGIDTVKQVEVFARVRDELGLGREEGASLRQYNTLRKVIERLAARLEERPTPAATPTPATTPTPLAPARVTPATAPARTAAATSAAATTPVPYPLAGVVVERSATRLVAERLFSVADDRYLSEACVGGKRCVPAAIAWEALAEAAELLVGAPIVGAQALRSAAPLLLDEHGRLATRLEIERSGDQLAATLFTVDAHGARVRVGAEFAVGAPTAISVPRDVVRALDRRGQSKNGHAVHAGDATHLGETLGGCVWARSLSFCELVGGIRADADALFDGEVPPRLVMAPGLFECAFMLAGFGWFALTRKSGIPVEIEAVALGRAPELGEEVLCHVRLRDGESDGVRCNVMLLGADRAPIVEMRGLKLAPVERVVDMAADAVDAVSWSRFCQALQDRHGGAR